MSISGRFGVPGYDANLLNYSISIYVDSVRQYYNETNRILANSSSIEDTNETQTDSDGLYSYNFTAQLDLRNYVIKINTSLFSIDGQNNFTLEVNNPCDEGDIITLCAISSPRGVLNGTLLEYNNLTIKDGGTLRNQTPTAYFKINASSIMIESGGRIEGNVNITAINVTILEGGLINASGLGHTGGSGGDGTAGSGMNGSGIGGGKRNAGTSAGGGAGYGNIGGNASSTSGGFAGGTGYGSPIIPIDYGSGGAGGDCNGANGGAGGGAVFINASNLLNVTGNITADGYEGISSGCDGYTGGGGSGGSVLLVTNVLAGNGSITSKGGISSGANSGGGGSGGRIAAYYSAKSYNGVLSSLSGTGYEGGGNGTNFTAKNLSVSLTLNPRSVNTSTSINISISGRVAIYEYEHNLTNQTD